MSAIQAVSLQFVSVRPAHGPMEDVPAVQPDCLLAAQVLRALLRDDVMPGQ